MTRGGGEKNESFFFRFVSDPGFQRCFGEDMGIHRTTFMGVQNHKLRNEQNHSKIG